MNENNILNYESELTPLQALRRAEQGQKEALFKAEKEGGEKAQEALSKSSRNLEDSLPVLEEAGMNDVMKGCEIQTAENEAAIAKNMQKAKLQGSEVLSRVTGKYEKVEDQSLPEGKAEACRNCVIRQATLKENDLTNYNMGGDKCRDCGSVLIVYKQELSF